MNDHREEYARARSMSDKELINWGLDSGDVFVRELANRYDVVLEKIDEIQADRRSTSASEKSP